MSRRMSVSMTLDAVRDMTKTVTRRHVDTWKNLRPGDRLTLIEKGMGLPKGARQVVVAEVEVVNVRVERLAVVTTEEVRREGLVDLAWESIARGEYVTVADWFVDFWCAGHGYRNLTTAEQALVACRRIEWRYLTSEANR